MKVLSQAHLLYSYYLYIYVFVVVVVVGLFIVFGVSSKIVGSWQFPSMSKVALEGPNK